MTTYDEWVAQLSYIADDLWAHHQDLHNAWSAELGASERFDIDDRVQRLKRQVTAMASATRELMFRDLLVEEGAALMRPEEAIPPGDGTYTAGFRLKYPTVTLVPDERRLVDELLAFNGGDIGIISSGATGALVASPWKYAFVRERVSDPSLIVRRDVKVDRDGKPVEPSVEPISSFVTNKKGK